MATLIPLSDFDMDGLEERELGERSNVASELAQALAMGGCAVDWNASQLTQAKRLVAPETTDDDGKTVPAGSFFGKLELSQAGKSSAKTQKVRGGKKVEVNRYKRERIIVRVVA
jgi:hypothetical protein